MGFNSESQLCLKQASIETYANYYAIHLEQLIEQRKQVDIRLTSGEAWYLLNSLVDAAAYLEELGIYFGVFLSRNISLSSEGYVKLYLYHLTPSTPLFIEITGTCCISTYWVTPLGMPTSTCQWPLSVWLCYGHGRTAWDHSTRERWKYLEWAWWCLRPCCYTPQDATSRAPPPTTIPPPSTRISCNGTWTSCRAYTHPNSHNCSQR